MKITTIIYVTNCYFIYGQIVSIGKQENNIIKKKNYTVNLHAC